MDPLINRSSLLAFDNNVIKHLDLFVTYITRLCILYFCCCRHVCNISLVNQPISCHMIALVPFFYFLSNMHFFFFTNKHSKRMSLVDTESTCGRSPLELEGTVIINKSENGCVWRKMWNYYQNPAEKIDARKK